MAAAMMVRPRFFVPFLPFPPSLRAVRRDGSRNHVWIGCDGWCRFRSVGRIRPFLVDHPTRSPEDWDAILVGKWTRSSVRSEENPAFPPERSVRRGRNRRTTGPSGTSLRSSLHVRCVTVGANALVSLRCCVSIVDEDPSVRSHVDGGVHEDDESNHVRCMPSSRDVEATCFSFGPRMGVQVHTNGTVDVPLTRSIRGDGAHARECE